jgi:hypothetical protein
MALFIILLREGLPLAVYVITDPDVWPYDWDNFTYCFADP